MNTNTNINTNQEPMTFVKGDIVNHSHGMTKRTALNLMNSPDQVNASMVEEPFTVTEYLTYMDVDNETGELRPVLSMLCADGSKVGVTSPIFMEAFANIVKVAKLPATVQVVHAKSKNGRAFIGCEVVEGGGLDELL